MNVCCALSLIVIALNTLSPSAVQAQEYPTKPIRIMTGAVGGGNDFASRLVAQGIAGPLGQPVIVDNRPSTVLGEIVSKAPPDGYTLVLAGGAFVLGPVMEKKASYDAIRDFSPITLIELSPSVAVVHPSIPAKNIKEFIALAKARPGALNYARAGIGSPAHLAAELFKSMAGVNIVGIPYNGGGPAAIDLIAGHVQLMFNSLTASMPHVKSGKLRALAVTSAAPTALAPGIPTVAASGLPGYKTSGITAVFAPVRTPDAVIRRLNQEIVRSITQPDAKKKFFDAGVEVIANSPEQSAATIKEEYATMSKLIRELEITTN